MCFNRAVVPVDRGGACWVPAIKRKKNSCSLFHISTVKNSLQSVCGLTLRYGAVVSVANTTTRIALVWKRKPDLTCISLQSSVLFWFLCEMSGGSGCRTVLFKLCCSFETRLTNQINIWTESYLAITHPDTHASACLLVFVHCTTSVFADKKSLWIFSISPAQVYPLLLLLLCFRNQERHKEHWHCWLHILL